MGLRNIDYDKNFNHRHKQKVKSGQAEQLVLLILHAEVGQPRILVSQQGIKILKNKKVLLVHGLRSIPQKFQPSAINIKYRCGQADQLVLLIVCAEVG